MTGAVCYAATGSGYLFSTVLSATQARQHLRAEYSVYVVYFAQPTTEVEEYRRFAEICRGEGVVPIRADLSLLRGLRPNFARFFMDLVLPDDVDRILYLDGDTQVLGDLSPLLDSTPVSDGAYATLDPMVFIREVDTGLRRSIDGWWDSSSIPDAIRRRYVNSGMLRLERSSLELVRTALLDRDVSSLNALKFLDQDAVNLVLDERLAAVSMRWNFPGFLLGTPLETLCSPRVVHFMSNPRPWNGPFRPWGFTYYWPYLAFAQKYPQVTPYWHRLRGLGAIRYVLQQQYKDWRESRIWSSDAACLTLSGLEAKAVPL